MNKEMGLGLFLCGIASSSLAIADCPTSMPEQLLEDCIVYEGAGSAFPPADYAYMDLYSHWLTEQGSTARNPQAEISAIEKTMN